MATVVSLFVVKIFSLLLDLIKTNKTKIIRSWNFYCTQECKLCGDCKEQQQNGTLMILAGGGELITKAKYHVIINSSYIWKYGTAPVVLNNWLEEQQTTVGH